MAKKKKDNIKSEFFKQLTTLTTTAFGLVAALAWNDAIRSLFEKDGALHFLSETGPWFYAILVTLLAVIVTIWIGKISKRLD